MKNLKRDIDNMLEDPKAKQSYENNKDRLQRIKSYAKHVTHVVRMLYPHC